MRTKSKTLAREAERNRRRALEERINGIRKRGRPPPGPGSFSADSQSEKTQKCESDWLQFGIYWIFARTQRGIVQTARE